jgi:hypothetical protein
MLKCEGLTIRQLRELMDPEAANHAKLDDKVRIDESVTNYLNDKPGTWTLISATTTNFGWYFIWAVKE